MAPIVAFGGDVVQLIVVSRARLIHLVGAVGRVYTFGFVSPATVAAVIHSVHLATLGYEQIVGVAPPWRMHLHGSTRR